MSSRLPVISGRELVRALERLGFQQVRQRGSHISLRGMTQEGERHTVVPLHPTLAKGTLSDILRQTGIDRERLREVL